MPYNTRRKSLSLPSLGISIPQQKPSPVASSSVVASESSLPPNMPPSKKMKRAHQLSPLSNVTTLSANSHYGATPPPSPPPSEPESYDDEIVAAVIDILKKSHNRPHTVKELAVMLTRMLAIVENSANPHAIISSRLNQYLKRPGQKRCLLAKELITTHPKRIYFYLTNCERQAIPTQDEAAAFMRQTIVSPAPSDDERERTPRERSPSPDVDFMFDDDLIADTRPTTAKVILTERRFMSPPLEGDEREFTQSAINIKRRSASRELEEQRRLKRSRDEMDSEESKDVDPLGISSELDAADDVYSASALTTVVDQEEEHHKHASWAPTETEETQTRSGSSKDGLSIDTALAAGFTNPWGNDVQSPESIGLHELDDLFDF
ncbi:hypothetical protein BJ508DRAFT_56740 [Ascobolus immersus RN42]|uniref:GDS1 winged helix domain-containing protein n=1 Tax=Ascobolus immersus RN42 TaxID=1160509 RepID=A0A3N4IPY0_ASCIM|nr:hypothetical protein BJ508DRAFT_56740 [Ascobolus immersus RN42]